MAAVITEIEVGTAFGAGHATAPLDGLVQVDLDRVDQDYSIDEGNDAPVRAKRLTVLRYEPPGNTPNLPYYDAQGQILTIKRKATPARIYDLQIKQVIETWEDRAGTQVLTLNIFLAPPSLHALGKLIEDAI